MTEAEEVVNQLMIDYPYWAKEVYKIRDKNNDLTPLELNEVQEEIGRVEAELLAKYGRARIFVLKARQGGITTDQQARSLHKIWSTPGTVALTIAHSQGDTEKIFQITKRAIQNFPSELLPTMGRSEAKEVTFTGIDSAFWTGTAGSTKVGKGITVTRFHGSEFAYWPKPRAVLASITPAMIPNGSVIVLETTPDTFDSEAHKFWEETLQGKTGYVGLFFPWWRCDRKNYRTPLLSDDELDPLTADELSLIEKEKLSLEQIKWRRERIIEMGVSSFMREYPEDPETCWTSSGEKFYDGDKIQIMLRKVTDPISTALGGRLKIYADRVLTTPAGIIYEDVIIGSDVAEGVGGDRSTWSAHAFPSWRLLSQFEDNKIEPDALADALALWGIEKYGEALLVVEKNAHGITVLRRLRDYHKYPRRSLYYRTPLATSFDSRTDYIGWTTTSESLPLMLDYGRQILNAAAEGHIPVLSRSTLKDFLLVTNEGRLNSRDVLVSEILAWLGRDYHVRRRVRVGKPLHW